MININKYRWYKGKELAHQVFGVPAIINQVLSPWGNYLTLLGLGFFILKCV